MDPIDRTQRKLQSAEQRKDWPAVLSWDRIIDRLTYKAMGQPDRRPGQPL